MTLPALPFGVGGRTGLWLTKKSESNLAILYGEIIVDSTILGDLLAADGDVVLAVERRTTFDAEDEKVALAADRVVRASRDLPPRPSRVRVEERRTAWWDCRSPSRATWTFSSR